MLQSLIRCGSLWALLFFVASCGKKPVKRERVGPENFSVTQFLDDHWEILNGQPFMVTRTETINDNFDSTYVELTQEHWDKIRAYFDATDISDTSFAEKYNFDLSKDIENGIMSLTFTAKSEDEFTQKLIVVADAFNQKVKSLYIETLEDGFLKYSSQKLSFVPFKNISIQQFDKSLFSSEIESKLVYKFPSKYD
jgi:hypothetical protein